MILQRPAKTIIYSPPNTIKISVPALTSITDKREIDFVVLKNKKPIFAVEVKTQSKAVSPHLFYFKERLKIPRYYQVSEEGPESHPEEGVIVTSFKRFCELEKMI